VGRIKQLSPQEAQKIAAGEVVERPANVVKELVENALDAGATQITIFIEDAGTSLIRVVDNGYGMDQEDAVACFGHHATSKLNRVEDLATLKTFGFRGEALSSISSVSKVTLITKQAETLHATKVILDQAIITHQESVTGNTGTDIAIKELFFNIPARKKFLKSTHTEMRHIVSLFQSFCLQYTTVSFKLYSQNDLLFNCPAAPHAASRIAQLWDHTIASHMVSVAKTTETFSLEGVITNHTYSRYDRSAIFFFVNKRWVKNYLLGKALLKGYLNVLQPDKFPLAAINITIDPALIDVNIHPRKEEVQFLQPRAIETALQTMVKEALETHLSAQLNKKVSFNPSIRSSNFATWPERKNNFNPEQSRDVSAMLQQPQHKQGSPIITIPQLSSEPNALLAVPAISQGPPAGTRDLSPLKDSSIIEQMYIQTPPSSEYSIIGQFNRTYILIEREESLFLVDQHAAHERILYEEFSHRFKESASVQLLFPQIIQLTGQELAIIEPFLNLFIENNIAVEIIGHNQLAIQAVPVHLKEIALEELIRQSIGWITDFQKLDSAEFAKNMHEKLHAQMACKAAVKAGDALTFGQMQKLLNDLENTQNRFTCPHGRPTGWALPLYEIEKKFKR